VVFSEVLTPWQAAGGAIALVGVTIAQRGGGVAPPPMAPAD